MLTDIKLSKVELSKIIQSGGSFGSWLGNLGKKAPANVAFALARDNLPRLLRNLTSSAINKFDRKTSGKEVARAGKGFTLFISNEGMEIINYNIIRRFRCIIRWSYWNSKRWNKKTRKRISVCIFSGFISTVSNFFSSKRCKRKRSKKSRKRIYGSKLLVPFHPFSNIKIINYSNLNQDLMTFFQEKKYLE